MAKIDNNNFKTDEETFREIIEDMLVTYCAKNADYGNSFEEALNNPKLGLTYAAGLIFNKSNRFINLHNQSSNARVNESITDTLLDLANYCIMTVIWLRKRQRKN